MRSYKCLLVSVWKYVCVCECVCVCVFAETSYFKAPHPSHCEESKRFCDVFVPKCPDRPLGKPGFAVFVCSESLGTKNLTRRLYQSWAMLVTLSCIGWFCDKAGCNKNQHEPFQNKSPKVINIYIHYIPTFDLFFVSRFTHMFHLFVWQGGTPWVVFPSSEKGHMVNRVIGVSKISKISETSDVVSTSWCFWGIRRWFQLCWTILNISQIGSFPRGSGWKLKNISELPPPSSRSATYGTFHLGIFGNLRNSSQKMVVVAGWNKLGQEITGVSLSTNQETHYVLPC